MYKSFYFHEMEHKTIDFKCILLLYLICFTFIICYDEHSVTNTRDIEQGANYLVATETCKILDLDPFNLDVQQYFEEEKYTSCSELDLLTYIEYDEENAYLKINGSLLSDYSLTSINCCYSNVSRGLNDSIDVDNTISISECIEFKNSTSISSEVVKVQCFNGFYQEVYSNVHHVIQPKSSPSSTESNNNYNILLIGIDTMSRLNLQRTMPKTFNFLQENKWIDLKGYNKIDDNTFPNLMAILTGMNLSQVNEFCHPDQSYLNNCSILWNKFKENGYTTAYAEDEAKLNTFNYYLKGFDAPPTDLYFRPYFLAAETLSVTHKYLMSYCLGPVTSGERMLHLIKDYLVTLKNQPKFGLFWMNSFSHNNINSAGCMDLVFEKFWQDLTDNNLLDNTFVVFFSDHGFRFGKIVYTYSGWLEQRLPFNYIYVPKSFQNDYPDQYDNLRENSNKLTNPFDIYMTLQEILKTASSDYTIKSSMACPKCKSLFELTPANRTCQEAAISQHWCTCQGHIFVDPQLPLIWAAGNFALKELNKQIVSYEEGFKCATYFLKRIITSAMTHTTDRKYLLIIFETIPQAVFEVTVSVRNHLNNSTRFNIHGVINRVDKYSGKSNCVTNRVLRTLCYCDGLFTKFKSTLSILFNW